MFVRGKHLRSLVGTAIVLLVVLSGLPAVAENIIERVAEGFSMRVPEGFVETESTHPKIALFLVSTSAAFPTFNVLLEPGSYSAADYDLATHEKTTLDSYREVGITDAKVVARSMMPFGSGNAPTIDIEFLSGGAALTASVTTVVGTTSKYHLTYLDTEPEFAGRRAFRDSLLKGFTLDDGSIIGTTLGGMQISMRYVIFGILLAALLGVIFFMKGSDQKSAESQVEQ